MTDRVDKIDRPEKVNVQYVGFQAKTRAREYTFLVRHPNGDREFTFLILNDAFGPSRISFQDAPAFCSDKLHRELAAFANDPPHTQYKVSELELTEYRDARAPKFTPGRFRPRKSV